MTDSNAEDFGKVPNTSEAFGKLPNDAERFGSVPNSSEPFRNLRNHSERTARHTLTVREVTRLFEEAGVPRTERSIINWCRPNRHGIPRLDVFFDENERRYYITPESVSRAIEEERAKHVAQGSPTASETEVPKQRDSASHSSSRSTDIRTGDLELQNRDLEIASRFKDKYIEKLESENDRHLQHLIGMSRYVGTLETQVIQLGGAPRGDASLPQGSEVSATVHAPGGSPVERSTFPQGGVAL